MTVAHIHLGKEGKNGPVNPGISIDKGVVKGVLTKDNLVEPLQGKTLVDLMKEIQGEMRMSMCIQSNILKMKFADKFKRYANKEKELT